MSDLTALAVHEDGPWESGYNVFAQHAYVESNDFTHDVRLLVSGDFANTEQKMAYAAEIARRLNEQANLAAELAEAKRTAEYWKAEHLAGNAVIDELRKELAALKKVAT